MLRTQIIGATGYGGLGLIELLHGHPNIRLTSLLAKTDAGQPVSTLFPHLRGFCDLMVEEIQDERVGEDADLVVFATPDGVSMSYARMLHEKGIAIVDYSGDFRFSKLSDHQRYNAGLAAGRAREHVCPELLAHSLYSVPELSRERIQGAKIVGNPGCFAVAMIIGLTPLLEAKAIKPGSIIVDGKTGISGAGKKPSAVNHFPERNDNLTAYRLATHQHGAEVMTVLGQRFGYPIGMTFVPHLMPITRGLMCTIYAELESPLDTAGLNAIYAKRYQGEPFVRVLEDGQVPSVKSVVGSNMCDIGGVVDQPNNRIAVVVVIDNLLKGQSGVALQNINLMFGFDERAGLGRLPCYP